MTVHAGLLNRVIALATRLGHYDDALSFQQAAYQRNKDNPQISYNLAVCYKIHGLFDEAKSLLQQLTTKQPSFYQAHYSQAELNTKVDAKQHIQKLQTLADKEKSIVEQQVYFHSLALNYEHLNDYKNAFKYFVLSTNQLLWYVSNVTKKYANITLLAN